MKNKYDHTSPREVSPWLTRLDRIMKNTLMGVVITRHANPKFVQNEVSGTSPVPLAPSPPHHSPIIPTALLLLHPCQLLLLLTSLNLTHLVEANRRSGSQVADSGRGQLEGNDVGEESRQEDAV